MAVEQLFSVALAYWPALLATAIVLYFLHSRYQQGLHAIPGPWYRSISVFPRMWSVYKGRSHEDDLKLHQKYGPIVRLAPTSFSISDPAEVAQLYGISTKFYKSRFYELSAVSDEEGIVPDPFILTDKKLHSRMKKNAANAYSMNGLVQMEPWIDPVTQRLLRLLDDQYARTQKPCDLGKLLQMYAMDAVFSITFARDLDFLEKGDRLGMLRTIDRATSYMAILGHIPWIHKFLLGNPHGARLILGDDPSQQELMNLAESEIAVARESKSTEDEPCTFLRRLVLNQRSHPESLTDREIFTHAFGNITAGSDTTAIALRSVFINLLRKPETYGKLCHEVRSQLSLPVQFSKANELPYLSAVIKEALRIHPSVGMMLARIVPAGGTTICGYFVPAGVEVGVNPWVLHLDEQIFPRPREFLPERWLTADEEHLKVMNRSFLTFGSGAHTCSGRHISLMEATKVIPSLLLQFDIRFADQGRDTVTYKNRWFTPQTGLNVVLQRRLPPIIVGK